MTGCCAETVKPNCDAIGYRPVEYRLGLNLLMLAYEGRQTSAMSGLMRYGRNDSNKPNICLPVGYREFCPNLLLWLIERPLSLDGVRCKALLQYKL